MVEGATYCAECSQKYTTGKIPLWSFLTELIDAIFNFESKTLKTYVNLFVPGKLTKDYFEGKQVRYLHPLRVFLITAAIFLGVASVQISNSLLPNVEKYENKVHSHFVKLGMLAKLDSMNIVLMPKDSIGVDSLNMDSLRKALELDILDTLGSNIFMTLDLDGTKDYKIPMHKLYESHPDTIVKELEINGVVNQLVMKQTIAFVKNPSGFIQKTIANLIWMIILLMPAIALILKLLYKKSNRYFVEHLVFSLHYHSLLFLVVSPFWWFRDWGFASTILLLAQPFLIFAMKRYYGQTWGKTILKWVLLSLSYLLIFWIFVLIYFGIGFILF